MAAVSLSGFQRGEGHKLNVIVSELSGLQAGLLLGYAALLWLPGLAMGALVGLRGWSLAALGPLLTYGLVAVSGPWLTRLGVLWQPSTAALVLLGTLAMLAVLGWPLRRWTTASRLARTPSPGAAPLPAWTAGGHAVVAVATAVSGLFGAAVLLAAFGGMASVPQDWDALLHAGGIRYIAETGDSGLYGMYRINSFASEEQVYYPNAYHLVAALVYQLTGAAIPAVLNAQSMLLPLMLALGLVAVVRAFHGRVALAGFAALVSPMATAMPYDLIWRGPLLPYATGLVLTLGFLVVLRGYLDRPSVCGALLLILSSAGLLGLHPSTLCTAVLFGVALLVQRWGSSPRRLPAEVALLVTAGITGAVVMLPALQGALSAADAVIGFTWPRTSTPAQAFGEVLGFSTAHPLPQYGLVAALALGVVGFRALGQLRWLPIAGVGFAALYVLSAGYDTTWAQWLTSLWWNDRFRLAAIAAMALLLVAAHGLARSYHRVVGWLLVPALRRLRGFRPACAALSFAVVLAGFLLVTAVGYPERNIDRTAGTYGPGLTVSQAELDAFQALDRLVRPGERVMNDRFDGSGWMYALAGVPPVAAHFGTSAIGAEPELLAMAFDEYDTNPAVREAAARLNVRWVVVAPGFVRGEAMHRQPGLDQLGQVSALQLVYDQAGVQIYALGGYPDPAAGGPVIARP